MMASRANLVYAARRLARPRPPHRVRSQALGRRAGGGTAKLNRVFVGGAGGFVGRNVARALRERGHWVDGWDNLDQTPTVPPDPRLTIRDLRDLRSKDLDGYDTVLMFAARKHVPASFEAPRDAAYNFDIDLHVAHCALSAGVERLIIASSCEVYGDQLGAPLAEDAPCQPQSPYAAAKLASEHAIVSLCQQSPASFCALRLFNVYGPDEDPRAVVPALLTQAVTSRELTVEGAGAQARDFAHVDDVAAVIARLVRLPSLPARLNIGTGQMTDVATVAAHVQRLWPDSTIRYVDGRPNDICAFRADAGRLRQLLPNVRMRPFATGFEQTAAAFTALQRRLEPEVA
jgi:nucleoside-diphosphate-sugar epimerase